MRRAIIKILVIGYVFFVFGQIVQAEAQTVVRVLAYPFPPFLNEDKRTGLTPDLLGLLNNSQDDYRFTLTIVDPDDRYTQLLSGKQHMLLFEKLKWNWQDKENVINFSRMLMKGGEVYVAKHTTDITQTFFNNVSLKSMALYEGYHYKFADYNADKKWLKANFNVHFANSHSEILNMVHKGKVDVGVVTLSYLKKHFINKPEALSKFEISNGFAQVYKLKALIHKKAPITVQVFEKLLNDLKRDFVLQEFLEKNGILRQWAF